MPPLTVKEPKSIASGRKKVTLLLIYVFLIRSKTNWEKLNPPYFQGEPKNRHKKTGNPRFYRSV